MASSSKKQSQQPGAANDNTMDFLKGVTKPEEKKTKSGGVPTVFGNEVAADKLAELYQHYKTAEADFRAQESILIESARIEYEDRSRSGNHVKTLNYAGKETGGVQVSFKDQFKGLKASQEQGLRNELGDKFNRYFQLNTEIGIKGECLTPESIGATVTTLREKLGDELFCKLFNVEISLGTKQDMDKLQFEIPEETRTLAGLEQYKPAVRVNK